MGSVGYDHWRMDGSFGVEFEVLKKVVGCAEVEVMEWAAGISSDAPMRFAGEGHLVGKEGVPLARSCAREVKCSD
jgi:hypothetical protein